MDDLISRAAAIAQIKENYCDWCDHTDLCQSCETRDCIATIEQQLPAVDAAPVVRCRDCRYWGTPFDINDTGFMVAHCEHFDESHAFSEQFYCASGERRDGE